MTPQHKRKGLYPRGLVIEKEKKTVSKRAIAVLIEIGFSFTGCQIITKRIEKRGLGAIFRGGL